MFPNDEVVAYGRANGLGSDYNDIMTAFLRDYYSSNLSLTDLWGRAWAEGYRSINGFTDFPGIANSEFYAPLTHSLILTRGTGNPTYTRATNAWEFDNEGKLITVPSGSARFGGARMVRNQLTYSEDISNAAWAALTGGVSVTANSITEDSSTGTHRRAQAAGTVGATQVFSCELKANGGPRSCVTILFGDNSAAKSINLITGTTFASTGGEADSASYTLVPIDDGWYRFTLTATTVTNSSPQIRLSNGTTTNYAGDGASGILIRKMQLENVTGQADQTASEYVSVGVLAAPYHGAGVDGVKYFDTNKDGSAIAASSLLGYHAEGARTNSLLYSRDLRNRASNNTWASTQNGSELCTNGDFSSDTGWNLGAGVTISGGKLSFATAATVGAYRYDALTAGKTYTYTVTVDSIATGSVRVSCGRNGVVFSAPGTYTGTILALENIHIGVLCVGATTAVIDDLSVKESTIQISTCTGIDNAANSASTITAGAADATILQTLSMAAAARSFSAYVKRRTGTGSVYITRDGGTNWTDITSSLGASWTRVKIENTSVLNPSVGFKIATSGDAIDVDVCQDEAGAFITSPIITTTAAVTRNADALSYTKTGNFSDTAGTLLFSQKLESLGNSGSVFAITIDANKSPAYKGDSGSKVISADGTSIVGTAPWPTDLSVHKAAGSWTTSPANRSMTRDGLSALSFASYDGSFNGTDVVFGFNGGTTYLHGYIKNTYIWSTALTNAQLQQVTA